MNWISNSGCECLATEDPVGRTICLLGSRQSARDCQLDLRLGPDRRLLLVGIGKGGSAVTALSWEMFNDNFPYSQDDAAYTINVPYNSLTMSSVAPDFFSGVPYRGINSYDPGNLLLFPGNHLFPSPRHIAWGPVERLFVRPTWLYEDIIQNAPRLC